ncbi:YjcZ family sporulation protein [Paenibacillus apii]
MGYGCVGGEDKGPGPVYPWFTSTATILVLYILLVIVLKTCWI